MDAFDGDAHTNTAESAFFSLKRGISDHHVGPTYLPRYLAGFGLPLNRRNKSDSERTKLARIGIESGRFAARATTRGEGLTRRPTNEKVRREWNGKLRIAPPVAGALKAALETSWRRLHQAAPEEA